MSSLKLQLRKIVAELSSQANKISDPEIKRRLYLIKAVVSSPKPVTRVCEARGVSADFFYKWAKILVKTRDLLNLKPRSRKPKHCPHQIPRRVEKRIRILRELEPADGPERISFNLKKFYNMRYSPSAVYASLKRQGLITKEYSKKLTKSHLKRYRRPLPGWLQMDVKYVPYLVDGEQFYQFNVVDHCTTWRYSRIYEHKSYESLERFLKELEINCPFPIWEIQTDNGKEFTDKYRTGSDGHPTGLHPLDVWCKQKEIKHKLIPIGEKELNGKVENTHKQDDREFYAKYSFSDYWQLEKYMRSWNERWNTQRATKSLGWKTPEEVITKACVGWVAGMWVLQNKLNLEPNRALKIDDAGNLFMKIPKAEITRAPKIKRAKKKSLVDRYLAWMDGEAKKLKIVLPMTLIYQNFSHSFTELGIG